MSQRRLVWKAFKEAGLLESDNPRVQEVLQHLRDNPDRCWTDLVSDYRKNYYDTFDLVVKALEESDDPMIRNTLIKLADAGQPKEQQLLAKIAADADFERNPVAAKRLGRVPIRQVEDTLKRRISPAATTETPVSAKPPTSRPRVRRAQP